jgi:hypothetical protein
MKTIKIIIVTLCLMCLLFIHNIDNAWNMVKNQRDLCESGIIVDMVDCNLTTCFKPEELYIFSITLLTALISTTIILMLIFF